MDSKTDRILNATQDLIVRYGIEKITVAEIARAAGVGKGTVYLYFKSKEDIYTTLFSRELARFEKQLLAKLELATDPVAELELLLVEVGLGLLENEFALQMLKHDYLVRLQRYIKYDNGQQNKEILFLAGVIERGIREGYLREVNPLVTALVIANNLLNILLFAAVSEEHFKTREIKKLQQTNIKLILYGLVKIEE